MKKRNLTARSLLFSVIGLIVCVAMLAGTTFAWFSTSVTTETNIVKTGDFSVILEYSTNNSDWTPLENSSQLFTGTGLDVLLPGQYTPIRYLKITNSNSYAVTGTVSIGATAHTWTDEETYPMVICSADSVSDVISNPATLTQGSFANTTVLNAVEIAGGQSKTVAVACYLPEDATQTNVQGSFTITVAAEQKHS